MSRIARSAGVSAVGGGIVGSALGGVAGGITSKQGGELRKDIGRGALYGGTRGVLTGAAAGGIGAMSGKGQENPSEAGALRYRGRSGGTIVGVAKGLTSAARGNVGIGALEALTGGFRGEIDAHVGSRVLGIQQRYKRQRRMGNPRYKAVLRKNKNHVYTTVYVLANPTPQERKRSQAQKKRRVARETGRSSSKGVTSRTRPHTKKRLRGRPSRR
jgi:hypothetical protein